LYGYAQSIFGGSSIQSNPNPLQIMSCQADLGQLLKLGFFTFKQYKTTKLADVFFYFQDDKKMIRYRDGKIVSTKGERFSQVTKEESEEMKKSYVSWQPAELTNRIKANPIFELNTDKFSFQHLVLVPLWLQDYLYFVYLKFSSFFVCDSFYLIPLLFFFEFCFHNFYQNICTKINYSIKEKLRWQLI